MLYRARLRVPFPCFVIPLLIRVYSLSRGYSQALGVYFSSVTCRAAINGLFAVIQDDGMDIAASQFRPSVQEGKLNQKAYPLDIATKSANHFAAGLHGATGSKQVINHEDALAGFYGIGMHFQLVGAIFQFIFLFNDFGG